MMKFPASVVDAPARFWSAIESWSGLKSSVLTLVLDDQAIDSEFLKKLFSVMDKFRERFPGGPGVASILVSPLASQRISRSDWGHRKDLRVLSRPLKINDFSMALTEIDQGVNSSKPIKRHRKRIAFESELKVLAVEDAAISRELFSKQLDLLGLAFEIVSDGLEALEILKSRRFDVILMDCQMPEMDGYEATQRIRGLASDSSHSYIIAVTAHAMTGDREKCLMSGMDDYVTKPMRIPDLREALVRAIACKSSDLLKS
jgi:CheY-like chemotaxis protein